MDASCVGIFGLFIIIYIKMPIIHCKIQLDDHDLPGHGKIQFIFERIPIILNFEDLNLVNTNDVKKISVLGDFKQPVCTLYELTYYFASSGNYFFQTTDSNGRLHDDEVRQAFAECPKAQMVYPLMFMQYNEIDEQVFKNIITQYGEFDRNGFGDTPEDEREEIKKKHVYNQIKIKFGGRSRIRCVRRGNRQKSKKTKNFRRRVLFTKKR